MDTDFSSIYIYIDRFALHPYCFVQDEHFDHSSTQVASLNHVKDSAGRAGHNMLPVVQLSRILPNASAADACVALHAKVVAECKHHFLNLLCQLTRWRKDQRLCIPDSVVDTGQRGD